VSRNVVRGFVGFLQKSAISMGDLSLVPHDPKGSHYKVSHQGTAIKGEELCMLLTHCRQGFQYQQAVLAKMA